MDTDNVIASIGCVGIIITVLLRILLPFAIIAAIIWEILHFENRAANPPLNETKTEQKGS